MVADGVLARHMAFVATAAVRFYVFLEIFRAVVVGEFFAGFDIFYCVDGHLAACYA